MASRKGKNKTLSQGEIEDMLKRGEKAEKAAHKRAAKAAKRFAKQELAPEDEALANNIRTQLANVSGYLYNPDYQYAHLRTEPPCDKPEYSDYTKKQMREEKEKPEQEECARKAEAVQLKLTTSVKDFAPLSQPTADSGLARKKKIDEAAEAIMPNIQRLSMLSDSSEESEDEDHDRSASTAPGKASGNVSSVAATLDTEATESSASPNANPSSSGKIPFPDFIDDSDLDRLSNAGSDPNMDDENAELDTANHVHPWPDLWSVYEHKPPNLSEGQWSIVNANLKTLGGPENGTINPRDEENFEAYQQIFDILKTCWLIMTGQIPPDGNVIAEKFLKPILERDQANMRATLAAYESTLLFRRNALKLPPPPWMSFLDEPEKRLSSSSVPGMGTPIQMASPPFMPCSPEMEAGSPFLKHTGDLYPVAANHSKSTPATPLSSKRSSAELNKYDSAKSDGPDSIQSNTKPLKVEKDSKHSSARSSFDLQPGSQTPTKRGRLASLSKSLKIPKSPKKGTRPQEMNPATDEEIVTTPQDAPPVPVIPAPFSAQNTPQTSFDTAASTPSFVASPVSPNLNRKISRSFDGTPSTSMAGLTSKKSLSFDSTFCSKGVDQQKPLPLGDAAGSTQSSSGKHTVTYFGTPSRNKVPSTTPEAHVFGHMAESPTTPESTGFMYANAAMRNAPNMSTTSLATQKHERKHSNASFGMKGVWSAIDQHIEELLNEFKGWIHDEEDVSKMTGWANVKDILKPMEYDEMRKLKPNELETMIEKVKAITHEDLSMQTRDEYYEARYPSCAPGHRPRTFVGLPVLALRIARPVLVAVNDHFSPLLNTEYELENYQFADRERRWRESNPDAGFPGPGVARPTDAEYLRAGYSSAWATRFLQWAQEQEQLWRYENIDLPTMNEPGGGFKRQGRTQEVRNVLNMVDERIHVDADTGDLKVEGGGATPKDDQMQAMFEKLAQREEHKGARQVWAACEDQILELAHIIEDADRLLEQMHETGVGPDGALAEYGLGLYSDVSTFDAAEERCDV